MPCVCSLQKYHRYYLHDSEHERSRCLCLRVEQESIVPSLPRASQPKHRGNAWRKERRYVVLRSLWTVGYSSKDALQQYEISLCLVNLQALYFCLMQLHNLAIFPISFKTKSKRMFKQKTTSFYGSEGWKHYQTVDPPPPPKGTVWWKAVFSDVKTAFTCTPALTWRGGGGNVVLVSLRVFSLKRSTVGDFVVPFRRVLRRQIMTRYFTITAQILACSLANFYHQ